MNYYIAQDRFGNYDLAHHGIKGQKWGVRRYQNEDGSLTDAGQKRYGRYGAKGLNKLDRDIAKTRYQKAKAIRKMTKDIQKGRLDKAKDREKLIKDLDKSISSGRKHSEQIIKNLEKSGYTINAKEKNRYVKAGNTAAVALIFGTTGLIPIVYGGSQLVKGHRYGGDNVGLVKGTKYSITDYDPDKKRR